MPLIDKKLDLIKNTLILGIGKLATQFMSFILLPIYTIFLDPEQFGTVDLITSYIVLLAPILMIQLDRAAFRQLIDARNNDIQSRIVISNTLRIVIPALLAASILYVTISFFLHIPYTLLIATAVLLTAFSGLFLQFARGIGKNMLFAVASITSGVTNLSLSLLLVVGMKLGVEGVLYSMIAANLVVVLYLFFALRLRTFISFSSHVSSSEMRRELIKFAWPLAPSAISWWFIRTFDRTLVTIFLGLVANGIYAAASRYSLILNALYSIFDLSWSESASMHINSKGRDKFFSDVYNASFRFFGAIGLVMIAITPFIFNIIVGPQFSSAYLFIPALVASALFSAAVSQYSVIYTAKNKTKRVLMTSVVVAALSVTLNFVLVPLIGVMGAALSSAIAFLIMAIWCHFDIKKYVVVTFTGDIFIKLVLAYAFTVLLYYSEVIYLNILNLIVSITVAFLLNRNMATVSFNKMLIKMKGIRARR